MMSDKKNQFAKSSLEEEKEMCNVMFSNYQLVLTETKGQLEKAKTRNDAFKVLVLENFEKDLANLHRDRLSQVMGYMLHNHDNYKEIK